MTTASFHRSIFAASLTVATGGNVVQEHTRYTVRVVRCAGPTVVGQAFSESIHPPIGIHITIYPIYVLPAIYDERKIHSIMQYRGCEENYLLTCMEYGSQTTLLSRVESAFLFRNSHSTFRMPWEMSDDGKWRRMNFLIAFAPVRYSTFDLPHPH
jgi:hypothetical protein